MADERIREGDPDEPRGINANLGDGDDAYVPDIRKPTSNIEVAKTFRKQITALGVLWVVFGVLLPGPTASCIQLACVRRANNPEVVVFYGAFALVWISFGVMACLKRVWAVYVGLGLSYLAVLTALVATVNYFPWSLSFMPCGCLALAACVSILQAHRVIACSRRMRVADIPLDHKPE
jgi:hypothetical protein